MLFARRIGWSLNRTNPTTEFKQSLDWKPSQIWEKNNGNFQQKLYSQKFKNQEIKHSQKQIQFWEIFLLKWNNTIEQSREQRCPYLSQHNIESLNLFTAKELVCIRLSYKNEI